MNRRELLKLLLSGVAGHALDVDRLLWVPGAKKIFLPPCSGLSYASIMRAELERIAPHIASLFERDDLLYTMIQKREVERISERQMRVPLVIRPGRV